LKQDYDKVLHPPKIDADRTYLKYCPVRAWIRLRCLGVMECDDYAV